MTYDEAVEILQDYITKNGLLDSEEERYLEYLDWNIHCENVTLDGEFSLKQLEAIIVVVKQNFKPYEIK